MMETSTKPKFSNGGIDRISNLPDDIIHNILSYLYIFDVVQLSVLSKKWYYLCSTIPYLEFDYITFGLEGVRRPIDWVVLADKFKDFINWVLISQRSSTLVRFKLSSGYMFDKMTIFRWMFTTTKRNVQELVLSFRCDEFELPFCVSACESLRVLKLDLSGAILKLPSHLGFCQLKLLCLENVELSDGHLTSCLLSKSPLLEKVILDECNLGTITMLDFSSTSLLYLSLTSINTTDYSSCTIKISCPNLKVLKYYAPVPKDVIIENLFSVEVVDIFLVNPPDPFEEIGMLVHKMIKNGPLSVLYLDMICIHGLYSVAQKVMNSLFTFDKLKFLKLDVGIYEDCMRAMMLLLKHSPNLEVLSLWSDENGGWEENWKLSDTHETIVCLESHLKLIQLSGFKCEENEMELLRFFLKNALVLEKLLIVWDRWDYKSEEATEVVLKYPRTSSHVVVTFRDVNPNGQNFNDRHYNVSKKRFLTKSILV